MGQEFVCLLAHKAHKSNPKTLYKVPVYSAKGSVDMLSASAVLPSPPWPNKLTFLILSGVYPMLILLYGCENKIMNYHGREARVSYNCTYSKTTATPLTIEYCCVCGCVYANQGGSSTDANFTANDAKNLKSF